MTIDELKQLRTDVITYRHIFDRVDALRDQLERITAQYGDTPRGGGSGDKMAGMVSQIVDLLDTMCGQLIEIEKRRHEAETAISALPAQQATVMYLRYIEGMSWKRVAREMHYSREYLGRIQQAAGERLEGRKE